MILAEIDVDEGQKKPVGFSLVRLLKLEETTNATSTTMRIRRGRRALLYTLRTFSSILSTETGELGSTSSSVWVKLLKRTVAFVSSGLSLHGTSKCTDEPDVQAIYRILPEYVGRGDAG